MSKGTKYLLVSLPTSITPSNHAEEALTALRNTVTSDGGNTSSFAIPNFKIGTLDALVQQADDLAKLNAACEGVVSKVGESLKTILDGDEEKVQQQKTINDSTSDLDAITWPCSGSLYIVQNQSTSTCGRFNGTRSSIGQTSLSQT
jgi:V-type H+-transporting ATPase subunit C